MWIIAAAMEIADKPSCVRYGLSVPLDQNGKVTAITKPFGLWRRKINEYRREVQNDMRLIYFCPLNINTNHFTLLEINEQMRMIYHYDSMAGLNIVRGRKRPTRVREAVEVGWFDESCGISVNPLQAEFKDFGFGYTEAVSGSGLRRPCANLLASPARSNRTVPLVA